MLCFRQVDLHSVWGLAVSIDRREYPLQQTLA